MLRFRQRWPNAAECCGCEVLTNRLGRKRAWWAHGAAIERFEEDIQPEIEAILKNVELNDADIYFRVYMIGRTQEASRPTIMICCADVSIGRRAKDSLRHSPVIRNNPGFCLGSIDFPLEQLAPVRGLALDVKSLGQVLDDNSHHPAAGIPVFAISDSATVGRRLFVTHPQTVEIYRYSTGGVVVANHGRFYQLTVGHIVDLPNGAHQPSRLDADACSFDGQSDSDFGDDFSVFEQDLRRASASIFNLSQSESSDAETEKTEANTVDCRSPADTDYITTNSDPTGSYIPEGPEQIPMIKVGTIAVHSQNGGTPGLDYALVEIHPPTEGDRINTVIPSTRDYLRPLHIRDVAGVGHKERRVIAITGSSGVMKGILVPGTTFLGRGNQKRPQKLYVVQLDGVVAEGDSGAAVVDITSGTLYGHMVSGCPGTRIAYIVAATDIFQTIESELQGQVTIASQKTIQKSPAKPPTTPSLADYSNEYELHGGYCNEENLNSTSVAGETHGDLEHGSWQRRNSPYTTSPLSSTSSSIIEEPDQLPKYTTLDESQVSSAPSNGQSRIPNTNAFVSIDGRPEVQATNSVLDVKINKPRTKGESSIMAFQTLEQHSGYKRGKKTKKKGYRQRRQTRARQGARIHKPSLRRLDNEPEGGSTFSPSEEKFQINIQGAMERENTMYMDGVEYEEEDESLLSLLFEPFRDGRQVSPEEEFIRTVYYCCSLQELQRGACMSHSNKTCLLDDRTNDGTNSVSLGNYGPLSVQSLYQKLSKQRFYNPDESSLGPTKHKLALPSQRPLRLSADRRLIYIPDVDSYGTAVLIATASPLQTRALGNVLYKYLEFQPGISVPFQSHFFHVYFCLPTYVWRSTTSSPQDTRLKRTGEPIRKVRDVSFLRAGSVSKSHSGEVDYLCEAQVSVSITGIDRWHWTGLCLVDTYFQPQGRHEAYYSYYTEDDEDTIRVDPFSQGTMDADLPFLDPREYFLRILDTRAKGFQQEWQYVVLNLRRSIEEYVNTFEFTSNTTSGERPDFNKSLIWIRQTKQLLHLLIRCLKRTIHYWDNSRITENAHSSFSVTCLSEIQETFSDVKIFVRDLEDLSSICDELSRSIKLAMTDETIHFMRFQTKAWRDIKTLRSFLLFLCYPTLLAAAMLSMSEKATPSFLGPNKLSFFVLSTVLILLTFIFGAVIYHWDWIKISLWQLGKNIQVYMFNLERLPRSNNERRFSDIGLA